jgi:hypothetical protein
MSIEVVIARFDENVSYISEINQQIFLYDKSGSVKNAKYIPCIGREDFTYLYHILNSEDNDNTHICFLQGNPFDHCPDILSILNSPIDSDLIWLNDYFGNKLIRTGLHGDAHHLHVGQITEMLFESTPEEWDFNPGAQFIISKQIIRSRNRKFWECCLDISTSVEEAAWKFERTWPLIFNLNIKSKSHL